MVFCRLVMLCRLGVGSGGTARSRRRDRSSGDRDRQSVTAFARLAPHVITRPVSEFQFARRRQRGCCAPARLTRMMPVENMTRSRN